MRVAFVSPLPPARSGIADYAAALLGPLQQQAAIDVISEQPASFDSSVYDAILYQIGNNPWHAFVYQMALRYPGIVVLHEANLHHLITDLTIRRDRWDLYLEEAEYNGGATALAFARRVQALEVGPDYEGLPMTRRLLQASRGVITHSRFTQDAVREQGFTGPVAVIPHGAWIPDVRPHAWRQRLGLDPESPLIGVFGFLKPYKRIAEGLRAFRRLVRMEPRAKMLLVGELHPDLPLADMARSLGIGPSIRHIPYAPEEDFVGYLAATDIVLNLRFPTVGESSGTLLRALGLGKPVLVSDVGSFAEYPDNVCLKVPVGAGEEDTIFEYLNMLVSQPRLRETLGQQARQWVQETCAWPSVAKQYLQFAQTVRDAQPWPPPVELATPAPAPLAPEVPPAPLVEPEYILGWAQDEGGRSYVETHKDRLIQTLELVPAGDASQRILEMGAYLQITPALHSKLGYGEVRGCYYGKLGRVDHREITSESGETFTCDVDHFDAEKDIYPYPDEHFDTVVCGELIEHLFGDPMHLMSEVNRILKPGGHFVLTTPNIASLRALNAILQGYHPGFFPAYLKPVEGEPTDARHNREYTPKEVWLLYHYAGFDVVRVDTGEFRHDPRPEHLWVEHLLERYKLPTDWRGDGIYALGRKAGPVRDRFPAFLYSGGD